MTIGPAFFGRTAVTLNPNDKHADIALSSANLVATKSTGDALRSVRATRGIDAADSGYFEAFVTTNTGAAFTVTTFMLIGVSRAAMPLTGSVGAEANGWSYYQDTGQKFTNNVGTAYGATWKTIGDIIGVAFKNGSVWFLKNNTPQGGGNPAAGTGAAFTGITGTIYPTLSLYKGVAAPKDLIGLRVANGQFTYAPPAGFLPWES